MLSQMRIKKLILPPTPLSNGRATFWSGAPAKRKGEMAVRGKEIGCTVENYYYYSYAFMPLTKYL